MSAQRFSHKSRKSEDVSRIINYELSQLYLATNFMFTVRKGDFSFIKRNKNTGRFSGKDDLVLDIFWRDGPSFEEVADVVSKYQYGPQPPNDERDYEDTPDRYNYRSDIPQVQCISLARGVG